MVLTACGNEKLKYEIVTQISKRVCENLGEEEEWWTTERSDDREKGVNRGRGRGATSLSKGRGRRNPVNREGKFRPLHMWWILAVLHWRESSATFLSRNLLLAMLLIKKNRHRIEWYNIYYSYSYYYYFFFFFFFRCLLGWTSKSLRHLSHCNSL